MQWILKLFFFLALPAAGAQFLPGNLFLLSLLDALFSALHLQSEPEKISGGQQSCSILCEQGLIVHLNIVLMGHLLLILIIKLAVIITTPQRQISFRLPLK